MLSNLGGLSNGMFNISRVLFAPFASYVMRLEIAKHVKPNGKVSDELYCWKRKKFRRFSTRVKEVVTRRLDLLDLLRRQRFSLTAAMILLSRP